MSRPNTPSYKTLNWSGHNKALKQRGSLTIHWPAAHGHTRARTGEIYTKGVNRIRLAAKAMQMMKGIDWWAWDTSLVSL